MRHLRPNRRRSTVSRCNRSAAWRVEMNMDDALPAALASNLDTAFVRLVEVHQDRLYSIALRLLGNHADAEEIAQDAFVRAYRALQSWEPGRIAALEVRPWLAQIVVNLCRNRFRRARPMVVPIDARNGVAHDLPSLDPEDSPHDVALRRDTARRWARLLAELPHHYRVPVVLRHVDGLSYEEMAAALGRPEGTLKAQVHRGIALLRSSAEQATQPEREVLSA
jgi:RNA polymerase sigma-70 factor (ECF subfamily)